MTTYFFSYNARDLGVYCARQILACHLDPYSPSVEYGFLTKARKQSAVQAPAAATGELPVFLQRKSVALELPGGLYYLRCRLTKMPEESIPMITKDMSAGYLFLLRVSFLSISLFA